jgi:hypothetical protein
MKEDLLGMCLAMRRHSINATNQVYMGKQSLKTEMMFLLAYFVLCYSIKKELTKHNSF